MELEEFKPGLMVKDSQGATGVLVPDLPGMLNCHEPNELGVVYDGSTASQGIDHNELEIIGSEDAVADYEKCGGGKGADCCKFLVCGSSGFDCERHGSLRWSLIFSSGMTAKREPDKPYPECQL